LSEFTVTTVNQPGIAQPFGFSLDYAYVYTGADTSETFIFNATDIYENSTQVEITLNFEIDTDRPVITLSKTGDIFTNQENFEFDVTVSDASDTATRVILNGAQIQSSESKSFTVSAPLAIGDNTIRVTSVDNVGNIASPAVLENINFDNTPFNLTLGSPSEGQELENGVAQISGVSERELASITVNGQALTLSENLVNFSGSFDFDEQFGELVLNIQATDRYGNTQSLSRPVFIQEILRKNLAYITDSREGKIHVYNSDDLSLVREISLDAVGFDPAVPGALKGRFSNIRLSVDKKRAFVIQAENEKIAVVDLEQDEIVFNSEFTMNRAPGNDPNITTLIPNNPIQVSDNGLFVFFAKGFTPELTFDDGSPTEPEAPGGLLIYNTQTRAFTSVDVLGIEPESIQVDSSGSKIYMSTNKASALVFDTSTNSDLETINIAVSGLKSNDVLLSNDESALYVSSTESNLLYKIDLTTKQLIQSINMGGQQRSLVRLGNGQKVFALVEKNGSSFLSTIDESSNIVSQELDLGFVANKMKANLDGTKIWVTSEASNQVKVVDLATNTITNTLSINSPLDVAFGFIDEKSTANIPPLASFDFSSNQVIAPATFSFDGSLSKDLDGSISSYSWDIDGNILSGLNTSFRFDTPGIYNVSLTVTDDDSVSRTKTIPVTLADRNAPPTALFYSKAITDFGEYKIEFDASRSFKTGGVIREYRWDFGDGKAGSGQNVIHTYENAGTYLVSLVVEDNFGFTSSITKAVSPSDVTPLNLTILSPRPGLLTNQSNIIIQGSLNENSDIIKIAGTRVLQNADKTFSGEVSLTDQGVNIFRVEALDGSNNNQIINLPVIYDSVAPILSEASPNGSTVVYKKTGDVEISVEGNEALQALTANSEAIVVSNNAQRQFTEILSFISSGQKNVEFRATDLAGNVGIVSTQFDLVIDNVAPVLAFDPALPNLTNQSQLSINAVATDDTPTNVSLTFNGQNINNGTSATLINGENKIIAKAIDSAGNESTIEQTVIYDGIAPSIQLSLDDGY
ncbi:MAG: PKD domain-containing protein, partial [Bdellovibrionales bacterium]|nr:PKD domain-containing protein [Bdellovibrionales bacterium]